MDLDDDLRVDSSESSRRIEAMAVWNRSEQTREHSVFRLGRYSVADSCARGATVAACVDR